MVNLNSVYCRYYRQKILFLLGINYHSYILYVVGFVIVIMHIVEKVAIFVIYCAKLCIYVYYIMYLLLLDHTICYCEEISGQSYYPISSMFCKNFCLKKLKFYIFNPAQIYKNLNRKNTLKHQIMFHFIFNFSSFV